MRTEEKLHKGRYSRWQEITGRWPIPAWRRKMGLWKTIRAAFKRALRKEEP